MEQINAKTILSVHDECRFETARGGVSSSMCIYSFHTPRLFISNPKSSTSERINSANPDGSQQKRGCCCCCSVTRSSPRSHEAPRTPSPRPSSVGCQVDHTERRETKGIPGRRWRGSGGGWTLPPLQQQQRRSGSQHRPPPKKATLSGSCRTKMERWSLPAPLDGKGMMNLLGNVLRLLGNIETWWAPSFRVQLSCLAVCRCCPYTRLKLMDQHGFPPFI